MNTVDPVTGDIRIDNSVKPVLKAVMPWPEDTFTLLTHDEQMKMLASIAGCGIPNAPDRFCAMQRRAGWIQREQQEDIVCMAKEHAQMKEAMQWFVDRVDAGEVRSRRTYAKYKEILASLRMK